MKIEETNPSGQQSKLPKDRVHMQPFINDDEIAADPEYIQMLLEYQNARWDESNVLLNNLLKKYPGNVKLEEFKKDFDFQYSFHKNAEVSDRDHARKDKAVRVRKAGIITVLVLVAVLVGAAIFAVIYSTLSNRQQSYNQSQIQMLGAQVQALLNSGQPEKASEIMAQMKLIDPNDPQVVALGIKTDELSAVNDLYLQAQQKIADGQDADALVLLQQVQAKAPNFKDAALLITQTDNRIQIKAISATATQAYNESRWEDAINGYEQVLALDPSIEDTALKEQLLNAYLRRIIQMLESDQTTIEDISKAELYYRRAIAMIPQSRTFSAERENLQKISSSLLIVKYSQTAAALVADPNQTPVSVNQAVNYMAKAANLDPKNNLLKNESDKITLYQVAFQDYLQMDWSSAIKTMLQLSALDKNYANGRANELLYESYVGRGNQYYSAGLYLDARKDYEAAETLAWEIGSKNSVKVFMVELALGKTLGQLRDYQNAASYFKYAAESVNYASRSTNADLVNNLTAAAGLYDSGAYRDSYNQYLKAMEDKNALFTDIQIEAHIGTCLAFLAGQYYTSVQAILDRNGLARSTQVTAEQSLLIPYLP
jgi:tetratricopeptide (TPR) repeat protein